MRFVSVQRLVLFCLEPSFGTLTPSFLISLKANTSTLPTTFKSMDKPGAVLTNRKRVVRAITFDGPFRLLDLPTEIRLQTLRYVLPDCSLIRARRCRGRRERKFKRGWPPYKCDERLYRLFSCSVARLREDGPSSSAILRVSKQIFPEALDVIYNNCTFEVILQLQHIIALSWSARTQYEVHLDIPLVQSMNVASCPFYTI